MKYRKVKVVRCEGAVKPELQKQRNAFFSKLRRYWAPEFYATDVDWLEFYNYKPIAIIEAKIYVSGHKSSVSEGQIACLTNLGNRAKLPFFLLFHDLFGEIFDLIPMNEIALDFHSRYEHLGKARSGDYCFPKERRLSQEEFLEFHCILRGLDPEIIATREILKIPFDEF